MTLADARSYFSDDFELDMRDPEKVRRQLVELACEGEHVLEAVRTLARFGALTMSVPPELRRLEATKTALEYLFDHPSCSWGELALYVRRHHKRAGSRNNRVLERLERAGVFSTRIELDRGMRTTSVELAPGAFRCEPDESAGLVELVDGAGPIPPVDDEHPDSDGSDELGPGERIVDGEVRYSARWLDGPRLVVAGVVAALALLITAPASASASPSSSWPIFPPPPPANLCVVKPFLCVFHNDELGPLSLCVRKPYLCIFANLRPWIETYPAPCTLRRPCPALFGGRRSS